MLSERPFRPNALITEDRDQIRNQFVTWFEEYSLIAQRSYSQLSRFLHGLTEELEAIHSTSKACQWLFEKRLHQIDTDIKESLTINQQLAPQNWQENWNCTTQLNKLLASMHVQSLQAANVQKNTLLQTQNKITNTALSLHLEHSEIHQIVTDAEQALQSFLQVSVDALNFAQRVNRAHQIGVTALYLPIVQTVSALRKQELKLNQTATLLIRILEMLKKQQTGWSQITQLMIETMAQIDSIELQIFKKKEPSITDVVERPTRKVPETPVIPGFQAHQKMVSLCFQCLYGNGTDAEVIVTDDYRLHIFALPNSKVLQFLVLGPEIKVGYISSLNLILSKGGSSSYSIFQEEPTEVKIQLYNSTEMAILKQILSESGCVISSS